MIRRHSECMTPRVARALKNGAVFEGRGVHLFPPHSRRSERKPFTIFALREKWMFLVSLEIQGNSNLRVHADAEQITIITNDINVGFFIVNILFCYQISLTYLQLLCACTIFGSFCVYIHWSTQKLKEDQISLILFSPNYMLSC